MGRCSLAAGRKQAPGPATTLTTLLDLRSSPSAALSPVSKTASLSGRPQSYQHFPIPRARPSTTFLPQETSLPSSVSSWRPFQPIARLSCGATFACAWPPRSENPVRGAAGTSRVSLKPSSAVFNKTVTLLYSQLFNREKRSLTTAQSVSDSQHEGCHVTKASNNKIICFLLTGLLMLLTL